MMLSNIYVSNGFKGLIDLLHQSQFTRNWMPNHQPIDIYGSGAIQSPSDELSRAIQSISHEVQVGQFTVSVMSCWGNFKSTSRQVGQFTVLGRTIHKWGNFQPYQYKQEETNLEIRNVIYLYLQNRAQNSFDDKFISQAFFSNY